MKQEIEKKMLDSEEAYQGNQRELEENLEIIAEEKRHFFRYLDNAAEQLRIISHRQTYEEALDLTSGFRIIEQTQEEAEHIVKKAHVSLEDKLEENQSNYRKQQDTYEEELYLLKKEENS